MADFSARAAEQPGPWQRQKTAPLAPRETGTVGAVSPNVSPPLPPSPAPPRSGLPLGWKVAGAVILLSPLVVGARKLMTQFRALRTLEGVAGTHVDHLAGPRHAPHAAGRKGDLVLHARDDAASSTGTPWLTLASTEDGVGHRPLIGALVDIGVGTRAPSDGPGPRREQARSVEVDDLPDPLLWWRFGWVDAAHQLHVAPSRTVRAETCTDGAAGARVETHADGVKLETFICPAEDDSFLLTTRATDLPDGAQLADETNAGPSKVVTAQGLSSGDEKVSTRFVVLADPSLGEPMRVLTIETRGAPFELTRAQVHIGQESFPAPLRLVYGETLAVRRARVTSGDVFAALAAVGRAPGEDRPARAAKVSITGESSGMVALQDDKGATALLARIASGRTLTLPRDFVARLALFDSGGVLAGAVTVGEGGSEIALPSPAAGTVEVNAVDEGHLPLPVHVLVRSLDGKAVPPLAVPAGVADAFAAGSSVYLTKGHGSFALAPGRYRLVVTHGTAYEIDAREISVVAGQTTKVDALVTRAVDTSEWTAGDFHLHAVPSPDAPVPLASRIACLVSEGLDLAVATDHNRITDYAPTVHQLGLEDRIVTVVGEEITSYGKSLWGHFNAYPLNPVGADVAPEDAVIPYYDVPPAQMFSDAHQHGAPFVQVNHGRMDPNIGYFDLTHFRASDGTADPSFSEGFDAVEAFNGVWIEKPERTRQGAADVIGLARRGLHVAMTGNSDSHQLLYEEAGYPRTYVHTPAMPLEGRTERVVAALGKHDSTVTSGPLVEMTVDGEPIGSTVKLAGRASVKVHVKVSAPSWVPVERIEIWRDDVVAVTAEVGAPRSGLRYEGDFDVPVDHDATLLAWAEATRPLPDVLPYPDARAIGFTALSYVDADGDGKITLEPR
jgi:hypothetical protein